MKELKLKYSKWIPFKGFYAISLFGRLVRRIKYKDKPVAPAVINHEGIHVCQAEDFCKGLIGFLIFYLLYFTEWLIKAIISLFTLCKVKAYYSISFEQEALYNEYNLEYQDNRKRFAWTKYIFKLIK